MELVENVNEFLEKDGKIKMLMIMSNTCGGCRVFEPVLDKVSKEHSVPAYKMNGPMNMEFMESLGTMSVPTLVLYKDNEIVHQIVGFRPEGDVIKALSEL